jgi:GT2 family glycosyltransferase
VSVVVATYRRADRLERLFAALGAQTHTAFELVVVDDASGDGTEQRLSELAKRASFPARVVVRERNGGPAAARQQGWGMAQHELVAFTDDDCVPRPGWLAALVAAAGPDRVVVGRTVAAPDQEHRRGLFSRTVEVSDATYAQTCNVAYPRALLEQLGGFDVRLRTGEDTDLALRAREAGAEVRFAPDAVVEHDIRASRWRSSMREAWSWSDLPGVVKKHPSVRHDLLHHRIWWKPTHPLALLAGAGAVGAAVEVARGTLPWAAVLVAPWVRQRLTTRRAGVGTRRLVASLPAQLAVDLTEVGAMARGSVRHRTLVL